MTTHVEAVEQRERRFGDRAAVGEIGEAAEAEAEDRLLAVQQRHRDHRHAGGLERPVDLGERQLRHAAALGPRWREGVGEHPAQLGGGRRIGVDRDRRPAQRVEAAHLVEPHHVVGVAVGVEQRVDAAQVPWASACWRRSVAVSTSSPGPSSTSR